VPSVPATCECVTIGNVQPKVASLLVSILVCRCGQGYSRATIVTPNDAQAIHSFVGLFDVASYRRTPTALGRHPFHATHQQSVRERESSEKKGRTRVVTSSHTRQKGKKISVRVPLYTSRGLNSVSIMQIPLSFPLPAAW